MGMGSGAGSSALASLYPMLQVTGVDLDDTMVAMARARYQRPNLEFMPGDIAAEIFHPESLDGIFDSSVLHHVTSFGGYDYSLAARCLENQVRALKAHGVLVVRDFLAPSSDAVLLDLPEHDGDAGDDPTTCSTAKLFEHFSRTFRALHKEPGFPLEEILESSSNAAFRRFRTTRRIAAEFILRKDYRADWESEVKEEYTFFTQREFEDLFGRLGLRLLASTPLRNPWVVRNRFVGKCVLTDLEGGCASFPATNYVIAGEKVQRGEGVRFRESSREDLREDERAQRPGFLEMSYYRNTETGHVHDLARRPHTSIDVVPYFEQGGDLFAVARMSYPRPILASLAKSSSLDECTPPHYVTEPLNVLQTDKPLGQTVEEMLSVHARIPSSRIRSFRAAGTYYPSPGGSQEEVRSVLVEVEPIFVETNISNLSEFTTSGRIRALDAEQVLRAAQVGGLPDARLELNVYDLFVQLGRSPGPWIGESISIESRSSIKTMTTTSALKARPHRRVFERAEESASSGFLDVQARTFSEIDADGHVLKSAILEYVVPKRLSTNTIVCALIARVGEQLCIGVDDDDLPASQCFDGNSDLLVAPAWRIPPGIASMDSARAWVRDRLREAYGLTLGETWELGGAYYPSAGMSPEVAFPIAIEVLHEGANGRKLHWVPLCEIGGNLAVLTDGHLRIAALRAAHALLQL